ncbi:MAG: transglycosylase SLT domain-containing protein [Oscillospiraceae bacterium]|nr:transglycosylase SLT domain-containing protein [Oscillospiraceae bacterium]
MANQCREKASKTNKSKLMKGRICAVLVMLVLIGGVAGFFLGRSSAPEKTLTVTKTVEVPVYKSAMLTDTSEVFLYDVPLSDSLQRYIYEICADEGVPVTMVLAMIEHESGFNPEVVSSTDDYGLMQINAINHERLEDKYRCANMTDPYQNIFCGVSIIGSYLERYEGDYTKALMAYNMGDYGARKAWDSGITSTRYSERILSLMAKYEEVSNAKSD